MYSDQGAQLVRAAAADLGRTIRVILYVDSRGMTAGVI